MTRINPTFNNQVNVNDNTAFFATESLKKKIVAQLAGKTPAQQEAIIEALLKFLDVNLLAALDMAYSVAPKPEPEQEQPKEG
jgi:hypothetical protein